MSGCRSLFQLFNTRLSRGGKVEECSTSLCKSDTICMMRSMRSESNCVVSFLPSCFSYQGLNRSSMQAFIQPGFTFRDRKRDTEVRPSCSSSAQVANDLCSRSRNQVAKRHS